MVGAHCHRCSRFAAVYVNVDESEIERKRMSEREEERDEAGERAHGAGHNGN